MKTQTEAERLADGLECDQWITHGPQWCYDAAAELRRLVSFNQQLMDEVARLKHPEPLPVKTYSGGKAWHVAPTQPLTDELQAQSTAEKSELETVPAKGGLFPDFSPIFGGITRDQK